MLGSNRYLNGLITVSYVKERARERKVRKEELLLNIYMHNERCQINLFSGEHDSDI